MALEKLPFLSYPVTFANADTLRRNVAQVNSAAGITEQQRKAMSIVFLLYNLYNETGNLDYIPQGEDQIPRILPKLIHDANALTQGFERSEFSALQTAIDYDSAYREADDESGLFPPNKVDEIIASTAQLWQLPEETLDRIYLLLEYRCNQEEGGRQQPG